ncbi:MAG TPA: glycosyltransferase [Terriglobales bacterium]|nr:glycosyltransferase [Terriglobales bacterium]
MKICLVSAFPPSRRGLNEYGFHIARELQQDSLSSLTILADQLDSGQDTSELENFDVQRVWRFNSFSTPVRLMQAVRRFKPDVLWFNLLFSTFGDSPVAAFSGLATPALTRLAGCYTHITLHHLMDNINLEDANVRFPRVYRLAGNVATRLLLMANSVSVLLPAYRRTLIEKYRGENVHFRAHGIFSARPEYPDFARRGNPSHRVLAFGKWGTYKRLEQLIDAFFILASKMPHARLVVAGSDHPMTPGYVDSTAKRFRDCANIEFTGYVPEEKIPELFGSASVLVMPYHSATGASGVAHLACQYGVPIISSDIPDFRSMAEDENLAINFYKIGDAQSMANEMLRLLRDSQMQREMAEQNFSAALRMTMPQVVRQYLRSFDLYQRSKALEPMSRFRRLPAWIPSRSSFFRAASPGWQLWM